jgi:RNA polymerase sigma-B factor
MLATTDRRDRTELIERYLPLARKLARRYAGRGDSYDDLVQVASIGLINAVDRFDPDRGCAFSSFAVPTIVGELKHYLRDTGWTVRMQRGSAERARAVTAAVAEFGPRRPTVRELAEYLEWSVEDVVDGLEAAEARYAASLDGAGGRIDRRLELAHDRLTVAAALKQLPANERDVLFLRVAEDLSQAEVAARVGVSQMQVSRLERRALSRLRELTA